MSDFSTSIVPNNKISSAGSRKSSSTTGLSRGGKNVFGSVGLLAIANVLERFDNISANDRNCIDLLKDMVKLGKYLKLMKDLNVKFHKEVLDDMREAVQLILSGAILCHLDRIILEEDEMIIDWPTRHKIILDMIRGLCSQGCRCLYGAQRHQTLQHSLLDENSNVKLFDFGISQILQSSNAQYANKDISIETSFAGTLGYIDPDYWETSRVSLNSDIYSFGMLLLNVISGKRHIVVEPDIFFLIEEAWRLHEEDRLTELIDPRLINTVDLINSSSMVRTIKIALWCIQRTSEMRPSASRVLAMLSSEEEIPKPRLDQSFYEYYSKDQISAYTSPAKSCVAKSSVADEYHSSEQEIPISTSPVGDNFLEEKFFSPIIPLELSGADFNVSQEDNWIPTFPPILSSADYNFSQEENWMPTPATKSFVAHDHYSEEEIPTPTPPIESSEEEIPFASPLVKSSVAYDNSLVKKIEESNSKWSDASLKTLRILCVFSIVSFICLFRMFTYVSPSVIQSSMKRTHCTY
ncbi:hypothetical protein SUGI_0703160 [Cryptomeria japonica]|nr:hypothetical protein SUGI_0703160 [Cryptomeria japonica]